MRRFISPSYLRFPRYFDISAGAILLVAGALKIAASFQHDAVLGLPDPILRITNRNLYLTVGLLEILLAYQLFTSKSRLVRSSILIWIVACFLLYRLGWWLSGVGRPCPCLGSGYRWWPWFALHLETVSTGAIVILSLLAFWRIVTLRFAGDPTNENH